MARVTPPAATDPRIGLPIEELETPVLLLDRAASDRNLAKMAAFFRDRPAKLRPHFKNHKCISLAKRQLAAGADGMTCATPGEAEILVEHGVSDVLIANQVVGTAKIERVARLAAHARIAVAIDHDDQAAAMSAAAEEAGTVVHVLIEVDIGMGRCGLPPGAPVVAFARRLEGMPGIRFAGLQAYEGHLVNILDRAERAQRSRAAMQLAIDTRRMLADAGLEAGVLSGGSTATHDSTGTLAGVDEIQAGTYATMDCQYKRLVPEFEIALSLLTRVISRPDPDRAVLDVGVKCGGHEFGVPVIRGYPDVEIPFFLAEEHVVVRRAPDWRIGETLHLIPSHACTTCNLHRQMVVHDGGVVVDVWPIEASGNAESVRRGGLSGAWGRAEP